MNLELLRQIRNLLLRLAAISFVLSLVMAFSTVALWDTWAGLAAQWFRTAPAELGPVVVNFFAFIKFYYVFILLAPALALHWSIKAGENKA